MMIMHLKKFNTHTLSLEMRNLGVTMISNANTNNSIQMGIHDKAS